MCVAVTLVTAVARANVVMKTVEINEGRSRNIDAVIVICEIT